MSNWGWLTVEKTTPDGCVYGSDTVYSSWDEGIAGLRALVRADLAGKRRVWDLIGHRTPRPWVW